MVIGNGLIAKAFSKYIQNNDIMVFASGVSNSASTKESDYSREFEMLKQYGQAEARFVYFSTLSVFDSSLEHTAYIKHKKQIEDYIQNHIENFVLFRLPIVVGRSANPHTLMNYIFNKIKNNETITVHTNACRFLIDVDDVTKYLSPIIESEMARSEMINVHLNNQIHISRLIELFEEQLGQTVLKEFVEKGSCYTANADMFLKYIKLTSMDTDKYAAELIRKYYSTTV